MEWNIVGFPNYKINDKGIVFSKRKGYRRGTTWVKEENWQPLKPVLDKGNGYYLVTLIGIDSTGKRIKKNHFIHRLLGQGFIPNPLNKPHINHIDGNKTNNTLANLEWATEQENSQHAVDNNLTTYIHCEKAVKQFTKDGKYINSFKSLQEAENLTGVARQNISKVLRHIRPFAGGYHWQYA